MSQSMRQVVCGWMTYQSTRFPASTVRGAARLSAEASAACDCAEFFTDFGLVTSLGSAGALSSSEESSSLPSSARYLAAPPRQLRYARGGPIRSLLYYTLVKIQTSEHHRVCGSPYSVLLDRT